MTPFVSKHPLKHDLFCILVSLLSTFIFQLYFLITKEINQASFIFLTNTYFIGLGLANIILAISHTMHKEPASHRNLAECFRSKKVAAFSLLITTLYPTLALQFGRAFFIRYSFGNDVSVKRTITLLTTLLIMSICLVAIAVGVVATIENPYVKNVVASLTMSCITILVVFTLSKQTNRFEIPNIHIKNIDITNFIRVLPDITLMAAPLIIIWLSNTHLSQTESSTFLSIMLCTAISGIIANVIQSAVIRSDYNPSKRKTLTVLTVNVLATATACLFFIPGQFTLMIWPISLSVLGTIQSSLAPSFRSSPKLKPKIVFCGVWALLLLIMLTISQEPTNLIHFLAFLMSGSITTIGLYVLMNPGKVKDTLGR